MGSLGGWGVKSSVPVMSYWASKNVSQPKKKNRGSDFFFWFRPLAGSGFAGTQLVAVRIAEGGKNGGSGGAERPPA